MPWRLARSLETLRAEVNAAFPRRSKSSDGTLGDAAHQARPSRHNVNPAGVVTALDLTHDPINGCDIHAIARRIAKNPHPNLEYIISNAQVAKRRTGFKWEPYRGSNPHTRHAHFAVGTGPDSDPQQPYDDTDPWGVAPGQEDDIVTPEDIKKIADAVWGKEIDLADGSKQPAWAILRFVQKDAHTAAAVSSAIDQQLDG